MSLIEKIEDGENAKAVAEKLYGNSLVAHSILAGKNGLTLSGYVSKSDGKFVGDSNCKATGFIPVWAESVIIAEGIRNQAYQAGCCCYDQDQKFIKVILSDMYSNTSASKTSQVLPANAAYVRLSFHNSEIAASPIRIYYSDYQISPSLLTKYTKNLEKDLSNYTLKTDTKKVEAEVGEIREKLYGCVDGESVEVIPYQDKSFNRESSVGFGSFMYNIQSPIQGQYIDSVAVNIAKEGTFTLVFSKNAGSASYEEVWSNTYSVVSGINKLKVARLLPSGEWLFFCKATDSATFNWDLSTTSQGGFMARLANGNWSNNDTGNLSIGVSILQKESLGDIDEIDKRLTTLENPNNTAKTFSILGDSIDTFTGYIPSSNLTFYPKFDVINYQQTWWGILIKKHKMQLVTNNSWSGSRVCGTLAASFGSRAKNLGEKPDYIFIKGGTNDFTDRTTIGDYNWGNTYSRTQFRQALCFTIEQIMTTYPNSKLVYLNLIGRTHGDVGFPLKYGNAVFNDYLVCIRDVCQFYGIKVVELQECINYFNADLYLADGLHPNAEGMKLIADYVYKSL